MKPTLHEFAFVSEWIVTIVRMVNKMKLKDIQCIPSSKLSYFEPSGKFMIPNPLQTPLTKDPSSKETEEKEEKNHNQNVDEKS